MSTPRQHPGLRPLALVVWALGLAACGPRASSPPTTTPEPVTGVEVIDLRGHVTLDPRANFQFTEGDVFLHVFLLDGSVFDGLLCYPRPDRCAVIELVRGQTPTTWSATLSDSLPDIVPVMIHFDVPTEGDWRRSPRVASRVVAAGLGEVGTTTLERDPASPPPEGLRERLRGEERLRRVYESIAMARRLASPSERQFPTSIPERPSPPPCRPTWVRDPEAVSWLGVSAPVALSWAFSLEADAASGTMRIVARRDRDCHGDLETLVLTARLDEYGDFERVGVESSADAPPP
ncbi:MAG: hypothetical protein U0230_09345 [Polyangiales bacterium]